jgi:hypothetical protein
MRRLLLLALAGLAWWLLVRRPRTAAERVTIGYEDGSSVVLDANGPDAERLLTSARGVLDR